MTKLSFKIFIFFYNLLVKSQNPRGQEGKKNNIAIGHNK